MTYSSLITLLSLIFSQDWSSLGPWPAIEFTESDRTLLFYINICRYCKAGETPFFKDWSRVMFSPRKGIVVNLLLKLNTTRCGYGFLCLVDRISFLSTTEPKFLIGCPWTKLLHFLSVVFVTNNVLYFNKVNDWIANVSAALPKHLSSLFYW